MPKRKIEGLFRGVKPKALWGNAGKEERQRYRQLLGIRKKGSAKKSPDLEYLIREAIKYENDYLRLPFATGFVVNEFLEGAIRNLPTKYITKNQLDLYTHSIKRG